MATARSDSGISEGVELDLPGLREDLAGVLRIGLVVSSLLLITGLLLAVIRGFPTSLQVGTPVHPGQLGANLLVLDPSAVLLLGFFVLIATPVGRVIASLVTFLRFGDRPYIGLTATVLTILAVSVGVGWVL
jgi:uncharacterized membrane protein